MSLLLNKLPYLVCMVDTAVVKYEDTTWSQVGIGEGYL
jgi:hypothetical protein